VPWKIVVEILIYDMRRGAFTLGLFAPNVFTLRLLILDFNQGCQIFPDTIYQNEGKHTKLPQHYPMSIK
jgi:hypothetical protein